MPDILVIGFQEICDLTATNMVSARSDIVEHGSSFDKHWSIVFSSVNATRWTQNVQTHLKQAYPNDTYVLLENDQLVGVWLAVFVRQNLASFVKCVCSIMTMKTINRSRSFCSILIWLCFPLLYNRNIAVDSVKTGMGGKLGNKGCVSTCDLSKFIID
jgi:hypothetical protein